MSPSATDPIRVLRVAANPADDTAVRPLRADDRLAVKSVSDDGTPLDGVRDGTVDCVVVDHDPPTVDGVSLLEAVRAVDPTVPFVLLDAGGDASVASAAVERDVTEYVPATADGHPEDIADRVVAAADDARGRRLRYYETILDSLDDGVYAIEPDDTIIYVNERYAEMKGVDRETLIGTDIYDWVTDETAQKARAARREMAHSDREVGVIEYEFTSMDGEGFPAEMRFARVPADGPFDRVGVIRDITERKQRERSLRRKNERLDRFASIVSHDLRNPLNVLDGSLELAERTDDPEHIERCRRAVDRMETLIDDLLALAREGFDVDAATPVELDEAAEEAWRSVEDPTATLTVESVPRVRADRERLVQLLENLFRNAVEHGSTDGGVAVEVGTVDGGFYVADDGPGIPADEREAVFEFGHSEDGTGIGLAVVERIAEAHGWSVDVTAGPAGGARFEFRGIDAVDSPD